MWYYFGGITLFLFGVQVATGILLLLYYRPTPTEAYESVQFIMTRVEFGWLVRSIHSWSANLMILAAFIHMFSVVFLRRLPQAARTHLAQRHGSAGAGAGIRLQRLPAALEQGLLLRHQGGHGHGRQRAADRSHASPAFCAAAKTWAAPRSPASSASTWPCCPAITTALLLVHLVLVQRFGMSTAARGWNRAPALREMPVFPQFLSARTDGLVRRAGRAGHAWRPSFPGNWARRPIPSPPRPRASARSGISWRRSTP